MQPDSKKIIHSSCYRRMLDDTFLCLLTAERMKEVKVVLSFLNKRQERKSESWKKISRDLNQHACVKGLKGDLAALYLPCVYSVLHVLQFPLVTSSSWGKKNSDFPFRAHYLFLFLVTGGVCLFVSLFYSDMWQFTQGRRVGCVGDGSETEFPPESGWQLFNMHSGLKCFFQTEGRRQFVGQSSADL